MVSALRKSEVSFNTNCTTFTESDFHLSLLVLALLSWLLLLQVTTYLHQQVVMRFFSQQESKKTGDRH